MRNPLYSVYITPKSSTQIPSPSLKCRKDPVTLFLSSGMPHIVEGVTTIDCQRQVRSWRLLRSIIAFLIPTCTCYYSDDWRYFKSYHHYPRHAVVSTTSVTGTIFGFRRGKVSICIQSNSCNTTPILLLELPILTAGLAQEMKSGLLRIALESKYGRKQNSSSSSLLSAPAWTVSCNGKKVGCAIKRRATQGDVEVLRLMRSVRVGTGVIKGKILDSADDVMYLRANFERISLSSNSESFYLISPDGSSGQELSIFFLRRR